LFPIIKSTKKITWAKDSFKDYPLKGYIEEEFLKSHFQEATHSMELKVLCSSIAQYLAKSFTLRKGLI